MPSDASTETPVSEDELVTRHLGAGESGESGESAELQPGAAIGRYVIVERIGAGGMGTVYHAYDPRLNRRVALKLLRDVVWASDATGEQRLIREAQALAQLSSPNVVQVYEVGTAEVGDRGELLFLAMEFAEGKTLRSWWRASTPKWREVVRVMLAAGHGLLDAHSVGLIHRDFKPANVLVSEDGRVRVVDFGLAKLTGDGLRGLSQDEPLRGLSRERGPDPDGSALSSMSEQLTEHGTVVGTPAYMAPEQHKGEPGDERSDQYAFCVSLYEALYGARPFSASKREDLVASKRAMRLAPLPGDRRVPSGLRKIVLRGMAADPQRRWPSVEALLRALEALLARRRRVAVVVGAAALATVASAGAFGGATRDSCAGAASSMDDVWADARQETLAAAFERSGARQADAAWSRVQRRLNDYAQAWRDGRTQACRAHRGGAQSSLLLDRRMACLDEALRNLSGVLETFAEADLQVVIHADEVAAELPWIARCADSDAMSAGVAPPADATLAQTVAEVRDAMAAARARLKAGKLVESLERATVTAALAEDTGYLPLRAEAQLLLGRAQVKMDRDTASAESLDTAFRWAVASGHDTVALAASTVHILVVGHNLGRPAQALARRTVIEALLERLDAPPQDRARASEAIASALRADRRFDEAHEQLVQALKIRRARATAEPLALASALNNYGNLLRDLERYDDCHAAFEESIALTSAAVGPGHPTVAGTLGNLVAAEIDRGRGAQALPLAERSWKILDDALGSQSAATATALGRLGGVRWLHGEREQAVTDLGAAIDVLQRERGPSHGSTITALSNYGALLVYSDRFEEARDPLERALAAAEAGDRRTRGNAVFLRRMLGQLELAEGNHDQARRHVERAVAAVESSSGAKSAKLVGPLEILSEVAEAEGMPQQALEHLRRALVVATDTALASRLRAGLHVRIAALLGRQDEWDGAVDQYVHALRVYEEAALGGDDSPTTKERTSEVDVALAEAQRRALGSGEKRGDK